MKKRLRQRNRHRLRLTGKMLIVAGLLSITLTLVVSWLVYLNLTNLSLTKASGNGEAGGNQLNANSEILSEFTWEKNPVVSATLGPDGFSSGKSAHSAPGGKGGTGGLSPGVSGKDIDLVIQSSTFFDQDGIDISIDYRRNEPTGDFLTRGNIFNFGMNKGFIVISYRVEDKKGGYKSINVTTDYEIPIDEIFRNYRFIYNPNEGKGEIFVNNVIVWSSSESPNTAMYWKNAGDLIVGRGMNGGGKDIPVFDNLIIRSAGSLTPINESLVNFMLEKSESGVNLHWSTTANDKADDFTLQRSTNGSDFTTVHIVKANPDMPEGDEYIYNDNAAAGLEILYYRLRQNFKDGKFVIHPVSAIKLKIEKELSIERVSPSPFDKAFDISYFIPGNGRVWIQLTDANGKIRSSETFKVSQGKNIHVYKDHTNLESGTYTLNLMFGDKRVSTKVIKA